MKDSVYEFLGVELRIRLTISFIYYVLAKDKLNIYLFNKANI